jgi:hypothetical protein
MQMFRGETVKDNVDRVYQLRLKRKRRKNA